MNPTRSDPASALWRRAILALLLAWLTQLAACGPGVGGTGTGAAQDPLAAFGAQPASVCAGPLAEALSCAADHPAAPPASADGTGVIMLADSAVSPRVLASVNGNLLQLESACPDLHFSGEWGTRPGEAARYFGSLTRGGVTELASLELTPAGLAVQASLRDAQGHLVLGPWLMHKVGATPGPACP